MLDPPSESAALLVDEWVLPITSLQRGGGCGILVDVAFSGECGRLLADIIEKKSFLFTHLYGLIKLVYKYHSGYLQPSLTPGLGPSVC